MLLQGKAVEIADCYPTALLYMHQFGQFNWLVG